MLLDFSRLRTHIAGGLQTGKRPDSTNVWTFNTNFRRSGVDTHGTQGADWVTFPEIFKQNGWTTLGKTLPLPCVSTAFVHGG